MRRPAPLPGSGSSSDEGAIGQDEPVVDDHDVADQPTEEVPDLRLAPVAPFSAAVRDDVRTTDHNGGDPLPSIEPDLAGDSEIAGETRVGVRDVWRAARARRRALRAEVRRFTVRSRRRRLAWMIGAGAVVALVVGSVGAAYSPLFAVERVHVLGSESLPAAEIEAALAGQVGTPLPLVDDSAVKAALVAFPQVESYTLEARPPHELVVRIVARTPIGVVRSEAGWSVVDGAGVVMSTTADRPAGLPEITVPAGLDSDAFRSLGQVVRALPDHIHAEMVGASATSRDDVTVDLASGSQVVWGSVDGSPEKAIVLDALMTVHPSGSVSVYDVTSPKAPVVR